MDSNRRGAGVAVQDAPRRPPQVDLRRSAEFTVLTMSGELDVATVDEFASQVRARFAPGHRIAVDLCGVTFMSASGVGACLAVQREGRAVDCDVAFANPQGIVHRVFQALDVEATLLGWLDRP
jgi:anti-anti-sigma factor